MSIAAFLLVLVFFRSVSAEERFFLETVEVFRVKRPQAEIKSSGKLRNDMPAENLKIFQKTVNRQAMSFPETLFLEGKSEGRKVALTFDDGPDSWATDRILDILASYEVKATFFIVGVNAEFYGQRVRKMKNSGHAVAGHSFNHTDFRELTPERMFKEQIEPVNRLLLKLTGDAPDFFRPPYGVVTDEQIRYTAGKKMRMVNWSVDSFDWDDQYNGVSEIIARVMQYAHPGAIILLHCGGRANNNTVLALPELIQRLKDEKYSFATVPEMLNVGAQH
ncbi:MAG: polysaccharide deacetylase family protein [Candidatus Wallbacteria bacterium]|nr:polysaccharide deacetylase family protein [Candidatus Wallbacteria bacterium]